MEARAAVALIETTAGPPAVLLIRRAERAGDPWSGHWALPGGRRDAGDPDLLATALRELREECGVQLGPESLVAALDIQWAGRHVGRALPVAPFHFRIDHRPGITPEPTEVAASLWCPLVRLRDHSAHRDGTVNPHLPARSYPHLPLDGHPLWGFTYGVLMRWLGLPVP
jgi:8-oxo-dGTP pyrophosphatase MutT (NUDIX family)